MFLMCVPLGGFRFVGFGIVVVAITVAELSEGAYAESGLSCCSSGGVGLGCFGECLAQYGVFSRLVYVGVQVVVFRWS